MAKPIPVFTVPTPEGPEDFSGCLGCLGVLLGLAILTGIAAFIAFEFFDVPISTTVETILTVAAWILAVGMLLAIHIVIGLVSLLWIPLIFVIYLFSDGDWGWVFTTNPTYWWFMEMNEREALVDYKYVSPVLSILVQVYILFWMFVKRS